MWGGDSSSDEEVSARKADLMSEKVDANVYADSEDGADRAGHAPRRCTDILCFIIFVAGTSFFFGYVYNYCSKNGDMRRLYHGYDYQGRLCGVDQDDMNQTLGTYLFWCRKRNDILGLDLAYPICTDSCPSSANETRNCVQFPPRVGAPVTLDSEGSFKQTIVYEFVAVPQYESTIFAHRYCMPKENAMMKQVTSFIQDQGFASKLVFRVGETLSAWPAILMSAILALILGFAFLFVILWLARCLVWTSLAVLVLGPLVGGIYLVYVGFNLGEDQLPATGDSQWDKIIGFTLIAVSLLFAVLTCCAKKAIDTAIAVVQCTCHCMFSMTSLLAEPFINVVSKMGVLCLLLAGFAWLLSCGEIQKMTIEEVGMASVPGSDLGGILRTFHYTENEYYLIFGYFFFIFWIMEIFNALGQFCISYAVQLWYFTPYDGDSDDKEDVPTCGVLQGMCVGLFYHIGSLSFGAFIIAVFRIIRLLVKTLINQTKGDESGVLACVGKIAECCLGCCQKCVEFLNKNAYMDIAITSSNFCTAAKRAMGIILTYLAEMAVLNGATWIIQILGIGSITVGSSYLTWLLIGNWGTFSDPTSEQFVESKELVTGVAAAISFLIAWSFMSVFDTVADSVLYCYAIEQKRRQAGMYGKDVRYAPAELSDLRESL